MTDEGPEDGHTFRLAITLRPSSKVVGEKTHHDADGFRPDGLQPIEVRAWNLQDALLKAAELPLSAWFPEEDDEGDPGAEAGSAGSAGRVPSQDG